MKLPLGTRLVFVGEVNPHGQDPRVALYHLPRRAAGDRLREHLGLRDVTYAKISKINLCAGTWSKKKAREAADEIFYSRVAFGGVIVALGTKVREALGCPGLAFFESATGVRPHIVSLPHPSGLNRLWNEPGARKRARQILTKLVPGIPWGELQDPTKWRLGRGDTRGEVAVKLAHQMLAGVHECKDGRHGEVCTRTQAGIREAMSLEAEACVILTVSALEGFDDSGGHLKLAGGLIADAIARRDEGKVTS